MHWELRKENHQIMRSTLELQINKITTMNAKLEKLKKDEDVAWENVQSAQKIVNAATAVWFPIFQERRWEQICEELRKEKPEN